MTKIILILSAIFLAISAGCGRMESESGYNFKTVEVKATIVNKVPPRTLVVSTDGGRFHNERIECEVPQWYYDKTIVGEIKEYKIKEYDFTK